jgi:hypothetical protein
MSCVDADGAPAKISRSTAGGRADAADALRIRLIAPEPDSPPAGA